MRATGTIADELRMAIRGFHEAASKERAELNMTTRFWVHVDQLVLAADLDESPEELLSSLSTHAKQIGPVGDFGYGTPVGESLKLVYQLGNELGTALKPTPAPAA